MCSGGRVSRCGQTQQHCDTASTNLIGSRTPTRLRDRQRPHPYLCALFPHGSPPRESRAIASAASPVAVPVVDFQPISDLASLLVPVLPVGISMFLTARTQLSVRDRFDFIAAFPDRGASLEASPSVLEDASNLACMAVKRRQPGTVPARLSSRHLGWYPGSSCSLGKRSNK